MRIVRCDVASVAAPFPQPLRFSEVPMTTNAAVVVHLEEADGAIGFGYAPTFSFGTAAVRSLIADDFASCLLDAELQTAPDAVVAMSDAAAIVGRVAGTARFAMGALEMAMLDIEAQLAGLPLHRLWGNATTSSRAYASGGWRHLDREQLVAFVIGAIDQGFEAVKLQVGLSPEEDAARLEAVRDAAGSQIGLMLDANQQIPREAIERWLDALAPFDPIWLEEPVAAEDHRLLGRVKRIAPFAIASGESETEKQLLCELLDRRVLDVIQPDAYRVGLTAMREVCDAAGRRGITSAPHMAHEVSAHVLSGRGDGGWLEYFDWFNDWWDEPVVPVGGRVMPNARAGHGLRLKEGWLDAHLSASLVTVSSSSGEHRRRDGLHHATMRGA